MILVATTEVDLFQENLDSSFIYPFKIKVYPFSLCSLYSSNPEMDCALVDRRVNEECEHLLHASTSEIEATSCILGPRWTCFLYLLSNKCISISVHTKIAFIGKHHFEILGLKRFARDIKVCPPN